VRIAVPILLIALLVSPAAAQSQGADEKAIREQIAKIEKGESGMATSDVIFWSGAYVRPTVGSEKGVPVEGDLSLDNRAPGSQKTKVTPVRIEVAKSGDLAYEYSDGELSYTLKSGQSVTTKTSILRVWRKENGVWKVAAQFARPHADQAGAANRTAAPKK